MKDEKVAKELNKLNTYCAMWVTLENEKEKLFREIQRSRNYTGGAIKSLVFHQSLIDKWTKKIVKKVQWFYDNEVDFNNEVATFVHTKYHNEGLGSF